jgi:galactokinase
LLLDCRSLEFRLVPLPPNVQLVICNSMVKHQLGASEYNTRRAECEEGVRRLSAALPGIVALRDVTLAQLEQHRALLSEVIYRRCRHIITENARVHAAAAALGTGKISELSPLMAESHRSMRDDYEISCPELDIMVAIAARQPGVYGARMTGGGFGGCTVNLMRPEAAAHFREEIHRLYYQRFGIAPHIYFCCPSSGAGEVKNSENIPTAT